MAKVLRGKATRQLAADLLRCMKIQGKADARHWIQGLQAEMSFAYATSGKPRAKAIYYCVNHDWLHGYKFPSKGFIVRAVEYIKVQ